MCKTLSQAIESHAGEHSKALLKYLKETGIDNWQDLTKSAFYDFRDTVLNSVASSSAKTYFAVFKAILDRYDQESGIPCTDYRTLLKAKDQKPLKTYLNMEDLTKLESVKVKGETEKFVLNEFLVSAWTGMRISDVREISLENVTGEFLSYVSIKTKVHAVLPMRPGLDRRIKWLQENALNISLAGYNNAIRRMCQRAGIDETVKVFKAGKEMEGPKWKFVSSHTGRVSFCTCLASVGAGLQEIKRMAGHTNTAMTERYIVPSGIEISEKAMAFFR